MLPDLLYRPGVLELVLATFIGAWLCGGAVFALWVWAVMRPKRDTVVRALAAELDASRELRTMNQQLADAVRVAKQQYEDAMRRMQKKGAA